MPRRKKEPAAVKYLLPEGVKEKIDIIVDNCALYKNKPVWKQKFYYIAEYIVLQNINEKLNVRKQYVNINELMTAKIIGVNNQEIADMLRHAVNAGLFKKDGISWQAQKYTSNGGKRINYIRRGKSCGYQFKEWRSLVEISITDNRSIYDNLTCKTRKIFLGYDKALKDYYDVLSQIKIDETNITEVLEQVLSEKKKKKGQKEKYSKFLEHFQCEYYQKKNKQYYTIPLDGAFVPVKNAAALSMVLSYRDNLMHGASVPCSPCKFRMVPYRKKKVVESDETTIARCNHSLFIINGGYLVPSRPVKHSRVYCAIANMKRELRKEVRLDGKKIIGLDIANSQPLIATILIKEYWQMTTGVIPDDVLQYQHDCEAGNFYNNFMDAMKIPAELRKLFKTDFFTKVFFSMHTDKQDVLKDLFINKYPSCWEAIGAIKGGLGSFEYPNFATSLQEKEAGIIFDDVNMGLIKRGIKAFNIFDSIYVNNRRDFETAKALTISAFNKYGINPTLKIEYETHLLENELLDTSENDDSGVLDTQILDETKKAAKRQPETGLTAEEQKYVDELEEICRKGEARSKEQELIRQSYLNRTVKGSSW